MIGARVPRLEDARFLTGQARYVADLARPGMLHAVVVRSPHAHARLRRLDAGPARLAPGVAAVVTAADLPPVPPIPVRVPTHGDLTPFLQRPLAADVVRYVGEPVAVVAADSRARAEDAAELLEADYEPLAAVVDAETALGPSAPAIHPSGNLATEWRVDLGDVDRAFREAACVVRERFQVQRHTAVPLETRGLLVEPDPGRGFLTVWGATKVPHTNRTVLATMLGMGEGQIRMAEPDVGGSFGARGEFYPEDYLVPFLALATGRPVRWIEDRLEHFQAINHSRQQSWEVALAATADGVLTALDARLLNDQGAYIRTHGDVVASHSSASLPGPYRIPHYRCHVRCALTNKTPTGTLRSPGMFEANFVREQAVDLVARRLGLAPAEVRRRSLIPPSEMPYRVGTVSVGRPTVFDTGDFPRVFERALQAFEAPAPAADPPPGPAATPPGDRATGRGVAALVEPSGLGPFEGARVEVDPQGRVSVMTGASSQGQGQETTLAQVAAEALTVSLAAVTVRHGDTGLLRHGGGTYASRAAVIAGTAVWQAAQKVKARALRWAARHLEAAVEDVVLEDGRLHVQGSRERGLTLGELARLVAPGHPGALGYPEGAQETEEDGLSATAYVRGHLSGTAVFSVHLAEVAVDRQTGQVAVTRYLVAADVGRAINPLIVEGQLVGGVVQGLGGALLEELVYDEGGQLLTGTFMDYLLPSAPEAPPVRTLVIEEARAPSNPLGVKGVGEVGSSGVGAAVASAVAAALGVPVTALPLTPDRVRRLARGAPAGGAGRS
jgi:carbon-monoxide dehydrogenase large subunit